MFLLKKKPSKIVNMNWRKEFNGEKKNLGVDIKFLVVDQSKFLDLFDEQLKEFVFHKTHPEKDLADNGNDYAALRFPFLNKSLAWSWEGVGYTMRINSGITGQKDLLIKDVKLVNIKIKCEDGGVVTLEFSAQCHPNDEDYNMLSNFLKIEQINLTLTPPKGGNVVQMEIEGEKASEKK